MDLMNFEWIYGSGLYGYILLGAIWGDISIIVIGFLQSQEIIENFWPMIFTFIGMILADVIFFFVGRSKSLVKLEKTKVGGKVIKKIDSTMDFLTLNNLMLALFYCKFITGVKFVINVYLGKKGTPFLKYFVLNIFMGVFWTIVAWVIGYLAGEGFGWILKYFESLTIALLVLLLVVGILFNISKKTKKHFDKKYHNPLH